MAEQTTTPAPDTVDDPTALPPAATPARRVTRTVMLPGAARPHHYRNGRLTRDGMLHVIRSGSSFTWQRPMKNADGTATVDQATGKQIMQPILINREQDVPSEADLAGESGDVDAVERVRKANEAEIDRLRAENATLKAQKPAAPPAGSPPTPPQAPPQPPNAKK